MMRVIPLALLLAVSLPVLAQEQHPLLGTWKILSQQAIVEGEAPENVFGEKPNGYLIITREGRLMTLLTQKTAKGGWAMRRELHFTSRWLRLVPSTASMGA